MQSCSICGEKTRMFVSRIPLCVTCYEAGPEQRKTRNLIYNSLLQEFALPAAAAAALPAPPLLTQIVPEAQKVLVAFLQADLDLSSTLLETAELSTSRRNVEAVLAKVRRALHLIRKLGKRITDPVASADIFNRADGLELRLETFPV